MTAMVAAFCAAAAPIPIPVPNASFEFPATPFVSPSVAEWQRTPKPPDYDDETNFAWDLAAGVFLNPGPGQDGHKENAEGRQALYLFAVPGNGILLDGTGPAGAFPAIYEPGNAYTLTVALIGGGGNMLEGTSLRLVLHAVTDAGERLTVAFDEILHSAQRFPTLTRFVDVAVTVPPVLPGDPWAGRPLGIGLYSAVQAGSGLEGGYWDVDNVRLTAFRPAELRITPVAGSETPRITWAGEAGLWYQVQTSDHLDAWSDWDAPLAGTGEPLTVRLPTDFTGPLYVRVRLVNW
ncbi:MAG: hypothetical protein KF791_00220 [Verrucomicrobiae bacterium]|nr:hypothetical protein [Verrucomicrobiae bacterium]